MKLRGKPTARLLSMAVLFGLALLALAGCASEAPQDALDPAGPYARDVDDLWQLVFWLAVAVFVLSEGLLLFILFRFRRRPGKADAPPQIHGNSRLEVAWTIAPALLLAAIAVPTIITIADMDDTPDEFIEIEVIGHQWWWEFHYPEEDVWTANELVIPAGVTAKLNITSDDVIHSFWVPRLNGKQDAIQGRTNVLLIEADEAGEFPGQCAEFCGISHANMRLRVVALEQADYDQWLQGQMQDRVEPAPGSPEAEGERLFLEGQCIACHAISGTAAQSRGVGPDLTHFGSRGTFAGAIFENTPENVAEWLADPPAMKEGALMPDYNLTDEQIQNLVAYLESLE